MTEAKTTEVKEETVNLSKAAQGVMDTVEKMTVLELSDLVKALEDKFGVVAAAPMAMAAGAPQASAGADAAEESSTVSLVLKGCGEKKIQVLKAVREITGLGLKEAKELVDSVPNPVKEDIEKEEAEKLKKVLEDAGAQVEIK
jgi:large subunit ribosomal protein L7/L12